MYRIFSVVRVAMQVVLENKNLISMDITKLTLTGRLYTKDFFLAVEFWFLSLHYYIATFFNILKFSLHSIS